MQGHDFVDGEFPEGDFFWISALEEVLPGQPVHVIRGANPEETEAIEQT